MKKKLTVAALAAGLMAMSSAAHAHDWAGNNRDWHPHNRCSLTLERIYQPNAGQPIHVVVINNTNRRVRYTLGIRLTRNGNNVFSDSVTIDNANNLERSERGTSNRFSGDLANTRAVARVTSCTLVRS